MLLYLFPKIVPFVSVEEESRARRSPDGSLIRRMRIAFWITKATGTQSEYVILLFYGNSGFVNASQFYVILKEYLLGKS